MKNHNYQLQLQTVHGLLLSYGSMWSNCRRLHQEDETGQFARSCQSAQVRSVRIQLFLKLLLGNPEKLPKRKIFLPDAAWARSRAEHPSVSYTHNRSFFLVSNLPLTHLRVCHPLVCDQDVGCAEVFNSMLMAAFTLYDRH